MRSSAFHLLPAGLLVSLATAIQLPDFRPFTSAISDILHESLPQIFDNTTQHDLLKRQYSNTCPEDFASCANLGAPNLCCITNAVCAPDQAGNVACCPLGAVCTGTITGYIASGTVDSNGALIGGAAATSTSDALIGGTASTTSFQFYSSSSTGLVAATTAATVATGSGDTTTGGGFIVEGSTTVASPAAGMRRAQIPKFVSAIVYLAEYLPI